MCPRSRRADLYPRRCVGCGSPDSSWGDCNSKVRVPNPSPPQPDRAPSDQAVGASGGVGRMQKTQCLGLVSGRRDGTPYPHLCKGMSDAHLLSLAACARGLAQPCAPSMDDLVVQVCAGEKSESPLSPRSQHLEQPVHPSAHTDARVRPPTSLLSCGLSTPRLLTLTFLEQVGAEGREAEMGVGRLETSQLCLPPLWKSVYFCWSQAG